MRKLFAIAAAVVAGSMFMGSGYAGAPDATTSYIGGVGDLTVICPSYPPTAPPEVTSLSIGGGCYDVPDGALLSSIEVNDDHATNVGFQVGWYSGEGRIGDFVAGLCNSAGLAVPEGAVSMRVFVDGPINGPADCDVAAPDGIGILGTISVLWALPQTDG